VRLGVGGETAPRMVLHARGALLRSLGVPGKKMWDFGTKGPGHQNLPQEGPPCPGSFSQPSLDTLGAKMRPRKHGPRLPNCPPGRSPMSGELVPGPPEGLGSSCGTLPRTKYLHRSTCSLGWVVKLHPGWSSMSSEHFSGLSESLGTKIEASPSRAQTTKISPRRVPHVRGAFPSHPWTPWGQK